MEENDRVCYTLHNSSLFNFTGNTAAIFSLLPTPPTIFTVLQHLLCRPNAYLNGDWAFLNAILGLKTASAHFPCPICTVHKSDLQPDPTKIYEPPELKPRLRRISDPVGEYSKHHESLVTVASEQIVPIPLHLFLDLGNKIIRRSYHWCLGEQLVRDAMRSVKSTHNHGSGGVATVHDLNGPELAQWVKQRRAAWCLERTARGSFFTADVPLMDTWIAGLHAHLLHRGDWDDKRQADFAELVDGIQRFWVTCTGLRVPPKLHMLTHAVGRRVRKKTRRARPLL